jgi:hypothetical protein
MKNRVNQAVLIFAIIVVLAWNYMRYTNKKLVERYETDKEELLRRIDGDEELKPVLTMVSVTKITSDQSIAQRAYDLAASNNREELMKLVESL